MNGERVLHFFEHFVDPGVRKVDFVDHRHDGQVMVHRGVGVGDRLGLDALKRVDQQHGALAAGQRTRNFVVKVDVPRRVDQVQLVLLAAELVLHRDRVRFDRDPPLPLQRHVVEQLLLHLALGNGARQLQQPIGQRALAVVDVGDDREVANELGVGHGGQELIGRLRERIRPRRALSRSAGRRRAQSIARGLAKPLRLLRFRRRG